MKRLVFAGAMSASMLGMFSFTETVRTKTSTASYYHDKFNGKRTASGEVFSNNALTAANKRLPFGTRVRVTNLKNQKSVVVRVNDRGPFIKNRALDLSKAAFDEISDMRDGVIPIRYEVVE